MRTKYHLLTGLILTVFFLANLLPVSAQRMTGNKNVISQERTVDHFTGINAGGAFNVQLTIKDQISVVVEADENLMDAITTKVENEILYISSSGIRNATKLNVYVTAPVISNLNFSGAATLSAANTLNASSIEIDASGASEINLDVDTDKIAVEASGAADVTLSGIADSAIMIASGASGIYAKDMLTQTAEVESSGAANISVNAEKLLKSKTSGAGDVKIYNDPEIESLDENIIRNRTFRVDEDGNTTRISAGGIHLEVIDDDTTKVILGNTSLTVDDDGNVSLKKVKRKKFNGHWVGFDLGINGFTDNNFDLTIPEEYDFLDLKYEKSIDVNLNFFEQDFNLINNKFGIVTGLGIRWNNFRLADNMVLVPDTTTIFGYNDMSKKWEKSKIVANYLTLPLLFEYQTNPYSNTGSFHVSAGMILGWRFRTYTKMMTKEGGRNVEKIKGESFHMNPFRYDVTARIGWGIINLYGTYSLNTIFKDGKGPELYPFAIGISLNGW
ncbi:MAG TPA: DUF2807 domain-containing protein [Bacteroidales bacterium]|nr:DUF2807 domain-containing protein [Bacteroidales bacterium]